MLWWCQCQRRHGSISQTIKLFITPLKRPQKTSNGKLYSHIVCSSIFHSVVASQAWTANGHSTKTLIFTATYPRSNHSLQYHYCYIWSNWTNTILLKKWVTFCHARSTNLPSTSHMASQDWQGVSGHSLPANHPVLSLVTPIKLCSLYWKRKPLGHTLSFSDRFKSCFFFCYFSFSFFLILIPSDSGIELWTTFVGFPGDGRSQSCIN